MPQMQFVAFEQKMLPQIDFEKNIIEKVSFQKDDKEKQITRKILVKKIFDKQISSK